MNPYKGCEILFLPKDSLHELPMYEEAMKSGDTEELLSEIKESKHYTLDPDMTYISMLHATKNNSFNR